MTLTSKDLDLEKLKHFVDEATDGNWWSNHRADIGSQVGAADIAYCRRTEDADFIAYTRNHIDEILRLARIGMEKEDLDRARAERDAKLKAKGYEP